MTGTDVGACCDAKTCADFPCTSSSKQAKSSPTQPTTGNDPTESECCEAITGKCTGNTASGDNVVCPSGFEPKSSPSTWSAGAADPQKFAACCQQPKCTASVAMVPAVPRGAPPTCTAAIGSQAAVAGTCALSGGYTDKS